MIVNIAMQQFLVFHPVKPITSGEGGAVTCKDPELYKKIKILREHGIVKDKRQFKKKKKCTAMVL